MARRDIIVYIRYEGADAVLVDINNNILTSQKYPIIYYTEKPNLKIRPLKTDGTPYALADFSAYNTWEFGIDNDWDQDTDPPVYHTSADTTFTVSEVTVDSTTYVQIALQISGNTAAFESDIGTSKELVTGVYAELAGFNVGETEPELVIQFPFIMRNKLVEVSGGTPDEPTSNYYTKAQADAKFTPLATANSVTLTDSTTTNLTLFDKTVYRSARIDGILDDGTNFNRFSGYVTYTTGTTAVKFTEQDDCVGFIDLTITADVSSNNVRLNFNNATGTDVEFDYVIYNYILLS